MKTELYIANKSSGKVWECSNSVTQAAWSTERTGAPGTLKFTVLKGGDLSYTEGDEVRFSVDGELQFFGWVFTKVKNRWGEIETTCYDRLRYFKANASYAFYGMTAGDILRQVAGDLQIATGVIDDTGYQIPSLIQEDEGCLDIIGEAVHRTLLNTGKIYVFFDDGTGVSLRESGKMLARTIVGEASLLTDYSYKTDIDEQTYNFIKLARPNEETGRADVFERVDSDAVRKWGLLQLYRQVDGALNDAQVREQASVLLQTYDRRMRTLKVSSLGVPGLRAGQWLYMQVPGLGDISLDQWVMLEKVTHTWENGVHTMEFETYPL